MTNHSPSRRLFLGAAGGLTAGLAAPAHAHTPGHNAPGHATAQGPEPFYGRYQAGIVTPMQDAIYFATFDLETDDRAALIAMLQRWTQAAARLAAGLPATPEPAAENEPPPDSGETRGLAPARLTITFGFGPDMFTLNGKDRYGIAHLRPQALVDLPPFNGDQLVAGQCGGALSVQACADNPQVAFHAVRQIARLGYGVARLKWVQDGFSTESLSRGTPRNLMGFKDGTMNPKPGQAPAVVWAEAADAPWMQDGSYMVARRIRIDLEHWDQMKLAFQERTFGRRKLSGAPLGGRQESDTPDFAAMDRNGNPVIPGNAHIRLAAAANNDGAQILRRSYSYNNGASFIAERWPPWHQGIAYDSGLFFQAYQKDPREGFIKLFDGMSKLDALNQFTTHVASAIFACPPGVRPGGYVGQTLFETA